eukprot:tig00021742_g23332.t1
MSQLTLDAAKRAVDEGRPVDLYSDQDVLTLLAWIEEGQIPGDCAMIMGYANWCGYSKAAQPILEELAQRMKGTHAIARVDADQYIKEQDPQGSKLVAGLPLNGYPTFVFAEKATEAPGDYDFDTAIVQVPRTADALEHYMNKNCGPHKSTFDLGKAQADVSAGRVIELDTAAELTSFLHAVEDDAFPGDGALVEGYASWCGHCKSLKPQYEKLALDLAGKVPVARIDADEARVFSLGNTTIAGYPTVVYFDDNGSADGVFEESKYEGMRTTDALRKFVDGFRSSLDEDVPLVSEEGAEFAGAEFGASWASSEEDALFGADEEAAGELPFEL